MPELILRSGKRAGKRIALPLGEAVIGRDDGCRIRLTSSDVSRRHCRLRCAKDEIVVFDLGSRNGTYINDSQISKPTPLRPGDLLRVGPFLFQAPGPADERTADEDITGWLTEEGTIAGNPPRGVKNDTTLMSEVDDAASSTAESELPTATASLDEIHHQAELRDPVVKQAAEIIRDYWAAKKGSR